MKKLIIHSCRECPLAKRKRRNVFCSILSKSGLTESLLNITKYYKTLTIPNICPLEDD